MGFRGGVRTHCLGEKHGERRWQILSFSWACPWPSQGYPLLDEQFFSRWLSWARTCNFRHRLYTVTTQLWHQYLLRINLFGWGFKTSILSSFLSLAINGVSFTTGLILAIGCPSLVLQSPTQHPLLISILRFRSTPPCYLLRLVDFNEICCKPFPGDRVVSHYIHLEPRSPGKAAEKVGHWGGIEVWAQCHENRHSQ